ncbi:MAG: penicillin acylase family protein [Bacteroidales bacterium]|jgi:penicillin amidase
MKNLKRIAIIFLAFIFIILIAAIVYTTRIKNKGLADYNQDIELQGLIEPVEVFRDACGIPHIYAKNEHDLYMATGYLMAQDRLWQMDLLRRVTLGRLSEIFGDEYIETDLLLRSLRFSAKSERILSTCDEDLLLTIEAYTKGVNHYIKDNKDNFPLEFTLLGYEPDAWEKTHTLNLISYMAWDLKSGWSEYILHKIAGITDSAHFVELLPEMENHTTYTFDQDHAELLAASKLNRLSALDLIGTDIFSGSNAWAVSGEKSVTGKPFMANDMHLDLNIPGIWMQMHQVIRGKLNVTGLMLPGQPFAIVGHNDSIAWGMTNTYVANLDFYEEKINPEDSNQYQLNGEWKDFYVKEETIACKDGSEHKRTFRYNHRGPVVSSIKKVKDKVLTIRWIGDEESNEFRTIYFLNRANNWTDFKEAFRTFRSISQNIVYADKQGNIGIYCCAGVPVRKRDQLYAILPGWTDEYEWQGLLGFEELPGEFNPERGYVSAANNRPVDDTYPHYIGLWYAPPYRINRIREMLQSEEKFSIEDFKRMQNDQQSKFAEDFLNIGLPALEGMQGMSEHEQLAYAMLLDWNCNMSPDKTEPTIFESWTRIFFESCFQDELGPELFNEYIKVQGLPDQAFFNILNNPGSVWLDNVHTVETEDMQSVMCSSFRKTIGELVAAYGTDTAAWVWGNIHQLTLKHPLSAVEALDKVFKLNRGPYEVGGSFHTVSPYRYENNSPDKVYFGSSHRSIYDLSDWGNDLSVIPTGNSGVCSGDHYCDQTGLYVSGDYHPDYFSEEQVSENALYKMKFVPVK